jgi:hypothetical protein
MMHTMKKMIRGINTLIILVAAAATMYGQINLSGKKIHELPALPSNIVDTNYLLIEADPINGKPYKVKKSTLIIGSSGVVDGNKGDITVSGLSWTINGSSVQNGKLAMMANNTIKGNVSGTTASPQDITTSNLATVLGVDAKMGYADTASLSNRINSKQATLISGTNLRTINGNTLLGSSDLVISGSFTWGNATGDIANETELVDSLRKKQDTIPLGTTSQYYRGDKTWQTLNKTAAGLANVDNTSDLDKPISNATTFALSQKQAQLVSGTNIKTINNLDLLGSGNLTIGGGGGSQTLDQTLAYGNTTDTTMGIGVGSINASAQVEIASTTKGFLPPRMTTSQVNAISSPAEGLHAYDLTTHKPKFHNGTGWRSFATIVETQNNIGIGVDALGVLTSGTDNAYIGFGAGLSLTTGSRNIGIGLYAGANVIDGVGSVAIGYQALFSATNPVGSTAIGYGTLRNVTTGDQNTGIGYNAGYGITNGIWNTFVGAQSGYVTTTGRYNTSIGAVSLATNDTGWYNTAIGAGALSGILTDHNTAIGYLSQDLGVDGSNNTSVGSESAAFGLHNHNVTAFGFRAIRWASDTNTIAIGQYALANTKPSNNTIAIGSLIGYPEYYLNAKYNSNILIGNEIGISNATVDTIMNNNIIIGHGITTELDSVIIIGMASQTKTYINTGSIIVGGSASPVTSAQIEMNSTTKGFLPPRMTKTQRDAISSPATGLVIYQTDNTPGLRCYNGTNWMRYTETAD